MILKKKNYYFNKIVVFFFIAIPFVTIYCQTEKPVFEIEGKVHHKDLPIENVHVINTSNKSNEVSNQYGSFLLKVSVADTIEVRTLAFEFKTIIVSQKNIDSNSLDIELQKRINELKEVQISSNGLSGNLEKDLLNIPYNVIDPSKKLGIPIFEGEPEEKIPSVMGVFGLDKQALRNLEIVPTIQIEPLLKHINGYYKKLKNKRKFKEGDKTVDNLLYFYGAAFFEKEYKILPDQVYNFLFFCVETEDSLISEFDNKNYTSVLEILNEKSLIFNK